MIQVDDIRIEEFRGIRDLSLALNSRSFLIWGPNGVGKSGVVDAIDFALTGKVARLTGVGSGGMTLKGHAPHIHQRTNPGAARVSVTLRDCSTDRTATLVRRVDAPSTFSLEPEVQDIRTAVEHMGQHPEVTLSRREIIRFILTEPGKRSEMVQAILNLRNVGEIRSNINRSRSNLDRSRKSTSSDIKSARNAVNRHFGLTEFAEAGAIAAINRQRSLLSLAAVEDLDPDTIAVGLTAHERSTSIMKETALRDINALVLQVSGPSELTNACTDLANTIVPVAGDTTLTHELMTLLLTESGSELVIDDTCPLCNTSWSSASDLRTHLERKLKRSRAAIEARDSIHEASRSLVDAILRHNRLVATVRPIALELGRDDALATLDAWVGLLEELQSRIATISGVLQASDTILENLLAVPEGFLEALDRLSSTVSRIPDIDQENAAIQFLAVARERLATLNTATEANVAADSAASNAEAIYNAYCSAQDDVLDRYYERVEADFTRWYRLLNDDEADFTADFGQVEGKLNLLVDFYSQAMVTPGAYHSEGHQDAMGLCLYLALMKQRLGAGFRLAVLDDVVMSIDSSHRRAICDLMKSELPDVQFIITTHDAVWARQLQATDVVPADGHVYFSQWNIDTGPLVTGDSDFWSEIATAMEVNDIPRAAWCLRRNLERELSEVAERYRGRVAFRADAQYTLGELADCVIGRFSKLLGKAAKIANSRNEPEATEYVAEWKQTWQDAVQAIEHDQWLVNPAVHFNAWFTFSRQDFAPVVAAWRDFLRIFDCSTCGQRLYVTQRDMSDASLRCDGRHIDLDL